MGNERLPTAMIVEDEVLVSMATRLQLEHIGYEVVGEVRTGEEAVQLACDLSPDLVIMDVQLAGDLDGIEAAHQITSSIETGVIFVSAFEKPQRPLPKGSLYLEKPLSEGSLRSSLEVLLNESR